MLGYTVFHEEMMRSLISSVHEGRSANTYIFEGETGLAVAEAAKLFAKALMCCDEKHAPCGRCSSCSVFDSGANADLIHLEPQPQKKTIGVKPARDSIAELMRKPFYSRRRVILCERGDILTPEAQNALLKVLEDPPQYVVFIIACENRSSIIPTVRSRSMKIKFEPVSDDIVRKYIEEKYPDDPRLDFLVKYCGGIPGRADELEKRNDLETLREAALDITPRFLSKNKIYAYEAAKFFEENKKNADELSNMVLMYIRDALVLSLCGGSIVNTDKTEKLSKLAAAYPPSVLAAGADEIIMMQKMLKNHIKPSAAALHAALKI